MITRVFSRVSTFFSGNEKSEEELNPFQNPFTNKIVAYSKEIGWKFEVVSENTVRMLFEHDNGRTQLVLFSRQQSGNDTEVVSIHSPVIYLSTLRNSDVDLKAFFNELLVLNAESSNYKWAFTPVSEEDEVLIASVDLLLDTMDLKEMGMAVSAVSAVADQMEERFGVDEF